MHTTRQSQFDENWARQGGQSKQNTTKERGPRRSRDRARKVRKRKVKRLEETPHHSVQRGQEEAAEGC